MVLLLSLVWEHGSHGEAWAPIAVRYPGDRRLERCRCPRWRRAPPPAGPRAAV